VNIGTLTVTLGVVSTDLDKIVPKLNTVAQRFRTFGYLTSATLTLPIIAAGKAALNAAKEFEFSMQKMVGLAGVAQSSVSQWSEAVLEMGPRVAKGPKELAEALYFIASSGIKGADALNVLEISAKAATAGLGETKDVADFLTSALNAYKGTNLTAAKAADILVAAVREGKGEASAFATAMGSIIPIASQLGVSLDQVAGGMAAITLTGSSVASAAVYLKGVFNSLLTASPKGDKEMAALGVMKTSYSELRAILSDGPNGLINLMQKLRDMQAQYGDELISDIFPNIRALTGYLSIAGKNFQYNTEIMKKISNASGSLARAFAGVSNTIKVQLDQAISKAQVSLIKFGQAIAPTVINILNKLVEKLGQLIEWWNSLSKEQQDHKLKVLAIIAIMGPLSLMISTVMYAVSGLAEAIKGLSVVYGFLMKEVSITSVWTKLGVALKGAVLGADVVASEMATASAAATARTAAATAAASRAGAAVKVIAAENILATGAEAAAAAKATKAAKELNAARAHGVNVLNFLKVNTKILAAEEAAAAAKAATSIRIASAASLSAATAQSAAAAKLAQAASAAAKAEIAMAEGMTAIAVSAEATMATIASLVIGIVGLAAALALIIPLWNKIKDMKKQLAEMKDVHAMTVPKEEISGQIDKLLFRNAGTSEKPKWMSRINDLSEEQLKEAQNLLAQRIVMEQEGLDSLRGISEEDLNNQQYVYDARKKIQTALRILEEDKKSGRYSTDEIKRWSDQTNTYIKSVQDSIERYKETIAKQEQLKGIMKDPEIEKAQKEIDRLNAQLTGIKRNQGAGGYSAEVVKDYTDQTNMAIKEQEDVIRKVIAAKREDIRINVGYAQANIAVFEKQKSEIERTLNVIQQYHEAVQRQVDFNDAFSKAWADMLTSIKVAEKMAVVNEKLGKTYDLAAAKADIYTSALEDLMKNFGVSEGSSAYKQIMKWLEELGIDFSETGKHAKELAEEMNAINIKTILMGNSFNRAGAELELYKKQYEYLMQDLSKKKPEELTIIDFSKADEALKKMNEAQNMLDMLTDSRQLTLLQDEANLFGTMASKVEVLGFELQSAERKLKNMLTQRRQGTSTGIIYTDADVKRELDNIQRIKQAQIELQSISDVSFLDKMNKSLGTAASQSALFEGKMSVLRDTLRYMHENSIGTIGDFEKIGNQLKEMEQAQRTAEVLDNAFNQLFDSLVEGGKNMAETLKMVLKSIVVDLIKTYVHMMILKSAMKAFGITTGVPASISKGDWLGNFVAGDPFKAAKGGTVPTGYLNDSYPSMLTSGERVVPAWKFEEAKRKGMQGIEFFDMPPMIYRPSKLATGGVVPGGYPNDTFPAWLSSGEAVIPLGKGSDSALDIVKKLEELINVTKDNTSDPTTAAMAMPAMTGVMNQGVQLFSKGMVEFQRIMDRAGKAELSSATMALPPTTPIDQTNVSKIISPLTAKMVEDMDKWYNSTTKGVMGGQYAGMGVGFMQNRENPPETTIGTPSLDILYKPIETLGTKIHNILSDMATTTAISASQFRYPTPEEFKTNRESSFYQGAMPTLNKSATWMMGNELVGGVVSKIPDALKALKNIPGITADAPDLGFHALNKEHWALHPGKLETGSTEEKVLLYMEAAANRMIPLIKKTPLMPKVQKIGMQVMRQGPSYDRDVEDLYPIITENFPILKKSKYINKRLGFIERNRYVSPHEGKYTGAWDEWQGSDNAERDLLQQYVYGNAKGLEKAGPDVTKLNWPRYQKLYPEAETFLMNSSIPHGSELETGYTRIYELFQKLGKNSLTKETLGVVGPHDNIAGYVESLQKVNDKFVLISQDIYKYNPKDYIKDWSGSRRGNQSVLKYDLTAEKQAGILDKIGKPFYLVQNNPIPDRWIKTIMDELGHTPLYGTTGVVAGGLGLSAASAKAQEGGKIPYGNISMPQLNLPSLPNPEDITQVTASLMSMGNGYLTAAEFAGKYSGILQQVADATKLVNDYTAAEIAAQGANTAAKTAESEAIKEYTNVKGQETKATEESITVAGMASDYLAQMAFMKIPGLNKGAGSQIAQQLLSKGLSFLFGMITGGIGGAAAGTVASELYNRTGSYAQGGIVPPGYNNDTFPARLTSGETIIPLNRLDSIVNKRSEPELQEVVFRIGQDELVGILRKANVKNNLY